MLDLALTSAIARQCRPRWRNRSLETAYGPITLSHPRSASSTIGITYLNLISHCYSLSTLSMETPWPSSDSPGPSCLWSLRLPVFPCSSVRSDDEALFIPTLLCAVSFLVHYHRASFRAFELPEGWQSPSPPWWLLGKCFNILFRWTYHDSSLVVNWAGAYINTVPQVKAPPCRTFYHSPWTNLSKIQSTQLVDAGVNCIPCPSIPRWTAWGRSQSLLRCLLWTIDEDDFKLDFGCIDIKWRWLSLEITSSAPFWMEFEMYIGRTYASMQTLMDFFCAIESALHLRE